MGRSCTSSTTFHTPIESSWQLKRNNMFSTVGAAGAKRRLTISYLDNLYLPLLAFPANFVSSARSPSSSSLFLKTHLQTNYGGSLAYRRLACLPLCGLNELTSSGEDSISSKGHHNVPEDHSLSWKPIFSFFLKTYSPKHFQVKMYKTQGVRTTFWRSDVEKVRAVVARSTFPSQKCRKLRFWATFWRSDVAKVDTDNNSNNNNNNNNNKHNSSHLSVNEWIRSAIRDSQQPTSAIGFLFWNIRHRLVRYYW